MRLTGHNQRTHRGEYVRLRAFSMHEGLSQTSPMAIPTRRDARVLEGWRRRLFAAAAPTASCF